MGKLRRYYYSNKAKIWKVIIGIFFVVVMVQLANAIVGSRENRTNTNINNQISKNTISKNENVVVSNDKSAISGNAVEPTKLKKETKIIENFFEFCNNNKYEDAYELLSEDCKKEFYKDINAFKENYIKSIYEGEIKKKVKIENWYNETYKVDIKEDIMATGNLDNKSYQDYITVIDQNGDKKLNLNSFVKNEELNRSTTQEDIIVTVLSKKVFMDYEEYTIRVDNKTENIILLDTKESSKTIYLLDNNDMKYYSYSHEILDGLLKVNSGFSTQLTIKFSKTFSSRQRAEQLVFSDIVLNYSQEDMKKAKFSIDI